MGSVLLVHRSGGDVTAENALTDARESSVALAMCVPAQTPAFMGIQHSWWHACLGARLVGLTPVTVWLARRR